MKRNKYEVLETRDTRRRALSMKRKNMWGKCLRETTGMAVVKRLYCYSNQRIARKRLGFHKVRILSFPLSPPPRAPPASCLGARENFLLLLNALVLDELNREKYLFSLNTVCSVPIRVFSVDVFPQHAMTVISPMYDFQE